MLEDGTYEAIVVDADHGAEPDSVVLDLALAAGAHKGEIVTVTANGLHRDALDLLAVPATIVVSNGSPTVTLEG